MSDPVRYGEHSPAVGGAACEACARTVPRLRVDHCHRHQWVRGAVCPSCNASMARIDQRVAPRMPINRGTVTLAQLIEHANRCPDCPKLTLADLSDTVQPFKRSDVPYALVWRPPPDLAEDARWAAYSLRRSKNDILTEAVREWLAAHHLSPKPSTTNFVATQEPT